MIKNIILDWSGTVIDDNLLPRVAEFCAFSTTTGRRLFVISTIEKAQFENQARRHGFRLFFTRTYLGVMDKAKAIHSLLAENDLSPAETLFVGDMVHDMEAARHGGVMAVAVLTGFDAVEKLAACQPDLIIRDFGILQRVLETAEQICSDEWIEIAGLEVKSKIGVSEKERERFQRLLVCLRFQIEPDFRELNDEFKKTVDYAGVAAAVGEVAEANEAQLLETLVSDIADSLMERFPIRRLELELKKFILPNVRYVSVKAVETRDHCHTQRLRKDSRSPAGQFSNQASSPGEADSMQTATEVDRRIERP